MFFATLDSDAGRIEQNAHIAAFETRAAAEAYLTSTYDPADWNIATIKIGAGRFGDCWIKVHSAPADDERYFAPFTRDQLYIAAPGQHPGGRAWWIEPSAEVLVVESVDAAE